MTDNGFDKNDTMNPRRDDEEKTELQGRLRSVYPTRAEEWDDAAPGADDDPAAAQGPVPTPGTGDAQESVNEDLRFELARHLGRRSFPAKREALVRTLVEEHAPDQLVDIARTLPQDGTTYENVQHMMEGLGRAPRV